MLRKLILLIITAIFLTGCGASAPAEGDLDQKETIRADSEPAETASAAMAPTDGALMDTVTVAETEAPAQAEGGAEYFYFTKYGGSIVDDEGRTVLIENRCSPTFTSPDPARAEWVGGILDRIGQDYAADSTNLQSYAEEFLAMNGDELFYSYSNYQQLGVARHDEAVVSLISLSSLYSGGTHPISVQVAYNLDIDNQRILRLEDVIEEKAAPELARMVREGVDGKFAVIDGGNGLFADYGDTISNSMIYGNMTPYWYLNDVGLVIFYNQYELGPYAAGIIKVELPYEDLEGILLEDFYPAEPSGSQGELVLKGEGKGDRLIPITLDEKEGVLLVGVEGTVFQVQLSEVMWLEDTPIAQDIRFSALSLGENDVLEIYGGDTDETKSFVIEFIDGRGEHRIVHIRDGALSEEP